MIVLDLSILNQKGTPMFNSDTFANRPAFGIVGRIFISTDTKEFFRDTGTSWELIGGPGSGTITGSGAATQIAFWNSPSTITGSNNLWYDSTNSYLGVNTNAPGNPLDVHGNLSSVAALNQTTATNNTLLSLLNSGTPLWRIGNFYTAGANDFGIFDVVNTLQQLTIVKATGQTFIGAKTTASGRLVVNSATADNHLQIVGANAPSIRIDNAGSGGTQRFVFGLATATNNFIQGATAGEFCISTQSAGNMLFGMWQTTNASEVMRITTANNLVIGSNADNGNRFQVTGTSYFSGNLGIGITNPVAPLNIFASNSATLYQTAGTGTGLGNGFYVGHTANISYVYNYNAFPIEFGTNNNTRMIMTSGGNLLVGNSVDNGQKCQINGNAYIYNNTNADARLFLQNTDSGSSVRAFIYAITTGNRYVGFLSYGANATGTTCGVSNASLQTIECGSDSSNFVIQSGISTIPLIFGTNNTERIRIKSNGVINFSNVPTSSTGLSAGDIWNNSGVLNIV